MKDKYTNNEQSERETKRINLQLHQKIPRKVNDLYLENYKILKKEVEGDTNK